MRDLNLRGEHGDVMKLSTSSLLDRDGEEESAAVPGEHGLLVLQKQKESLDATPHKNAVNIRHRYEFSFLQNCEKVKVIKSNAELISARN